MGKNILYIANYYLEDVIDQRGAREFISQAGQNKSAYIIDMLKAGGNHVTVWSNAWTDSKSFRFYRGFQSVLDPDVYYSDIFGAPFFNVYCCKKSCKKFIERQQKRQQIDTIVFYNMRLENAPVARYAKKKFGIPIILQYEDGLTQDARVTGIKKKLYARMERKTLPELSGAFLVNSQIPVCCPSVTIRGAIRKKRTSKKESSAGDNWGRHSGRRPVLLFASTLDRQRGIDVLLRALQYTTADFVLQITGKGEGLARVREFADERVEYLGYLDYEAYQDTLRNADICISAQLSHHEFGSFSFPSKICEYLSEGKLVVSSDVADAKTALSGIAFLYEDDDPQKLARALEQAIWTWQDETKYREYMSGIDRFIEENSMEKIAGEVNRLLNQITGNDRS